MPLERIADMSRPCKHPEHKFTGDKARLQPGVYRYTCPGCGKAVIFASHPGVTFLPAEER